MKITSNVAKIVGEIFFAGAMLIVVVLVVQARVNEGPVKKVYHSSDESRCWVEVVENGKLVEYPCTGKFANAANDPSFASVNVATQYMVDTMDQQAGTDKKLASSKRMK